MPPSSSYLRYLPPILWDGHDTDLPLGQLLCIFEKVLTGLDDGIALPMPGRTGARPRGRAPESITATIDRVHELFDPWRTPEEFLPWLASWVALEFPAHPVADGGRRPLWDEYQRRKVTAEIAQLYRLRGLRDGLTRFIELYTAVSPRPRIAVDEGSRLLALDLRPQGSGRVVTLLSRNPSTFFTRDEDTRRQTLTVAREAPVHPRCLALASDGSLFLGDLGTVDGWLAPQGSGAAPPKIAAGIWRYPSLDTVSTAEPERIALRDGDGAPVTIENPIALVVDPAPPGCLYILDRRDSAGEDVGFVLRVDSQDWSVVTRSESVRGTRWPVGMVLDPDRRLVILDRGGSIALGDPPSPRLFRFAPPGLPAAQRPGFPPDLLQGVVEPLAVALLADGNVLIGDGGRQSDDSPGGLVHVTLSDDTWTPVPLQVGPPDVPTNPLVAPVALVETEPGLVTVVDLGLKPHVSNADPNDTSLGGTAFLRHRCDPAVVYQADLRSEPVAVTRVSETGQLVLPTDAVASGSTLYIADKGESAPASTYFMPREWRAEPHSFGLVVHFPPEPHTTPESRQQMLRTITTIVAREMPAHSAMFYAFEYTKSSE